MKLYFAGGESKNHTACLVENDAENILQSYYYVLPSVGPYVGDKADLLLDSGGFSAKMLGAEVKVEDLAEFVNRYGIRKVFNLDVGHTDQIMKNQAFLEKECPNTYIIPIIHFADWYNKEERWQLDWMVERYPYIAAGGWAGFKEIKDDQTHGYLKWIFNKTRDKVRVHGLGIATIKLYHLYPFYSVDHTTWVSFNKYGRSLYFNYVKKNRDQNNMRYWYKGKTYWEKCAVEVFAWKEIAKEATNIWKHRGVTWEEFDVNEWIGKVR